jgi:hypothetical protein
MAAMVAQLGPWRRPGAGARVSHIATGGARRWRENQPVGGAAAGGEAGERRRERPPAAARAGELGDPRWCPCRENGGDSWNGERNGERVRIGGTLGPKLSPVGTGCDQNDPMAQKRRLGRTNQPPCTI